MSGKDVLMEKIDKDFLPSLSPTIPSLSEHFYEEKSEEKKERRKFLERRESEKTTVTDVS